MIEKVQLKNFRSHAATQIVLAKFSLFLGSMGAGKSSILHAISLLLSGQSPLVNAKGEGLRREIRDGESEFQIALKLLTGTVIDQKVNENRNSIGVDGAYKDVRAQRGRISGALGCSDDVIQALLDPTQFFTRDEKSQRKTLLQLMSSKELDAPPMVKKLGLADSFRSVGQVDELIKDVKTVRIHDLNREIGTLQKQIPDEVEFSAGKMTTLRQQIEASKQARDAASRKRGATEEWQKTWEKLKAEVEAAKSEGSITKLEETLASSKKSKANAEAEVNGLREQYMMKVKSLNEGKEKATSTATSAQNSESTFKIISGMGKRCGVIDVFECPLKDADKWKMASSVEAQVKQYRRENETLTQAIAAIQKEVSELEAKGAAAKKVIASADSEIAVLQRKIDHQKEVAERLAKHQAEPPETGNWPKELAEASERLAAAEIDLKALEDAQGINSRRNIQVAEVRSKQTEAADLDTAVKELTALKDELLQAGSSGFVEVMKDVVCEFGFKDVTYSSDPFGFFCDGLLPDQLSGGEKVVVEAALRLAAAKTSGLNLMALDDANKIGESERNKLAGILMKSGVQVILCSTTEVEPKPFTPPSGVKVFWFNKPSRTGVSTVKEITKAA